MKTLEEHSQIAYKWLDDALGLWANNGVNSLSGSFCEKLDYEGLDTKSDTRTLVQARQIYTYSHAYQMGIYNSLEPAINSAKFIIEHADTDNGWIHKLAFNGEQVNKKVESYDQAFVLLAFGWLHSQNKDNQIKELLDKTLLNLEDNFSLDLGYRESIPDNNQPRRQNPHMHLFEAFLALARLTGEAKYLNKAHLIFELFENIFFDSTNKVVREFFTSDWLPHKETYDYIEPGHCMEWVWLLRQYQELYPKANVDDYCNSLYESAIKLGYNTKDKILVDCVTPKGKVILSTSRCWPQTEAIKASLVQYKFTGDTMYRNICSNILSSLWSKYFTSCPVGGWRDQFNDQGECITPDMPASTFYHVFVCLQQLVLLHGNKG